MHTRDGMKWFHWYKPGNEDHQIPEEALPEDTDPSVRKKRTKKGWDDCSRCGKYAKMQRHHIFQRKTWGRLHNTVTVEICDACHKDIHDLQDALAAKILRAHWPLFAELQAREISKCPKELFFQLPDEPIDKEILPKDRPNPNLLARHQWLKGKF